MEGRLRYEAVQCCFHGVIFVFVVAFVAELFKL